MTHELSFKSEELSFVRYKRYVSHQVYDVLEWVNHVPEKPIISAM